MTYLDANATEPLRPEAREAALAAMDLVGNPSSVHGAGRAARSVLEAARRRVAERFGARPANVVFTSGGTEANALAIGGFGRRVVVGATEHPSVLGAVAHVDVLPVDQHGVARLDLLPDLLRHGPALLCLMLANNETGTMQPVAHAAAICHAYGALLHVDAVQVAGRLQLDFGALGADSLAVSGHKMGAPKGAGALLLTPGREILPVIRGGGQERGRRGGTPALPAIAGLGAACTLKLAETGALRRSIEQAAEARGAIVLGGADRLPNTSCLALPGVAAETQVIALDLAGVQVSAGAACSSGKVARSPVLEAMGLGDLAGQAIRVSLPWNATAGDVVAFVSAYRRLGAGQGALAFG